MHEGGTERALFAVLSGKMEVVRLIDGVERSLGWRAAGTISAKSRLPRLPFGGYRVSNPRASCAWRPSSISRSLRRRPRFRSRSARWRASASAACRASLPRPQAARHHVRRALGPDLRRFAPLPVAQPDYLRLGDRRTSPEAGDAWPERHHRRTTIARCCGWPTAR